MDGAIVAYAWDTTISSTSHGVNAAAASGGPIGTRADLQNEGIYDWDQLDIAEARAAHAEAKAADDPDHTADAHPCLRRAG